MKREVMHPKVWGGDAPETPTDWRIAQHAPADTRHAAEKSRAILAEKG